MSPPARPRLGFTPDVARAAVRDADLRRLQAAWLAVNAGRWAFLVASLVVAYEAGGAVAVGLLGLARFLVPSLVAPFVGAPATRWRPERVLLAVNALRAVAVALAIPVAIADWPLALFYLLVAFEAGAGAFTQPLHMGLLPSLARTPAELVAANVASSAVEGIGTFAGPALASVLLATMGPAGAYAGVLVIYLLGVVAIVPLTVPAVRARAIDGGGVRRQLGAGVRAIALVPGPRLVVLGFGAQTVVRGLLVVLTVAASMELLGMGEAGVGVLSAAMGAGGVAGAIAAIALAGRPRLAPWFSLALAGWGLPIAVIGVLAEPAVALAMMVAIGVSNAVLDITGFTLLQRTIPNDTRVAVMGLLDAVGTGGQAIGGLVAPILLGLLGIEASLVVTGVLLPVVALAGWPGLRQVDDQAVIPVDQLARIRAVPLFAPLSLAILEHLAGRLAAVHFPAGAALMREGEPGDRYYLVTSGSATVSQGGVTLGRVGPGDGVGEIALLRDIPRTATVRADDDVEALALERADFLEAVTGHPASRDEADRLVTDRLGVPDAPG